MITFCGGRFGEYWPEVVTVGTKRSEVRAKAIEGQYSPVRLEQAKMVISLFNGSWSNLFIWNLPAFAKKIYTAYDRFRGNDPYGKYGGSKNQSERSVLL